MDSVNVSRAISLTTILYGKTSVSGHGQCICGQCQCEPGYTSDNCGCPTSTETCLTENFNEVSNCNWSVSENETQTSLKTHNVKL